ncbi:MAG: ABC transporter ATP-binding protein [Xanthobacteraceae bacterium]|nr:MAG: ABC transporter ATP-binding protein [Xanthobacteraceae bacterium]
MLIEVRGLSKSFGSVVVADQIDLEVKAGEAVGIIGPNGAGKTTLFNLITGCVRPDGGNVILNGVDITDSNVALRSRAGIGRTFQIPLPFEKLTVFENLLVSAVYGNGESESESIERCADILTRTGLIDFANRPAGALTLLQRKRLELARALATQPQLLMLDEIAGGLSEAECHELVETIRGINASGVTIIWIEHIVHALLAIVSRLIVFKLGKKIAEGEPRAVMQSPEVQEIYMGLPT